MKKKYPNKMGYEANMKTVFCLNGTFPPWEKKPQFHVWQVDIPLALREIDFLWVQRTNTFVCTYILCYLAFVLYIHSISIHTDIFGLKIYFFCVPRHKANTRKMRFFIGKFTLKMCVTRTILDIFRNFTQKS